MKGNSTYESKFALGDVARDTISGLQGVVTAITFWRYGCTRATIQPVDLKDGKPVESSWFDEPQLELVTAQKEPVAAPSGGPRPDPTRGRDQR